MIQNIPLDSIFKSALRSGADLAEVFLESSQRTTIICDDNRLETITTSIDSGLGLRTIQNSKTAYGSTNDLSRDALTDLALSVGKAAARNKGHCTLQPILSKRGETLRAVKSHPNGIPIEKKRHLVERANRVARAASPKVVQAKVLLKDHIRRIWVATSDGVDVADEQIYIAFMVQVICADGETLQMSYEPLGGTKGYEIFDETTPEEVAAAATNRALMMLKASPAPTGVMPVVLSGVAGGTMIHEAVGHGLEADYTGEGLSVYRDRIGQRVASPIISVFDDATLPGLRGSFNYDDEGSIAQRTCLIGDGILLNYLHNRITAARDQKQTTSNARRQSYAHPPMVRMTNTFIAPGHDKTDDIISGTERGLFIKKMGGGQVNTVNGDFVFDVQEGYRIERGMIGEPVRGATLTGNGPKVLEIIDKVGDDVGFSIGTCGKHAQEIPVSCGQPTLRIPEIVVGGTA